MRCASPPDNVGRRLADLQIIQADVVQRLQFVFDLGNVVEQLECLLDIHLEHVGDRVALELHGERFAIEAMSLADRAGHPDVGQKIHFQASRAIAFAGLAASAIDVETEPSRLVAALLGGRQLREQIANVVEQLDVGARDSTVACGRSATGRWRSSCPGAASPSS